MAKMASSTVYFRNYSHAHCIFSQTDKKKFNSFLSLQMQIGFVKVKLSHKAAPNVFKLL